MPSVGEVLTTTLQIFSVKFLKLFVIWHQIVLPDGVKMAEEIAQNRATQNGRQ